MQNNGESRVQNIDNKFDFFGYIFLINKFEIFWIRQMVKCFDGGNLTMASTSVSVTTTIGIMRY